jgi:hypothetical protein
MSETEALAAILRGPEWTGIYVKNGVGATYLGKRHFCALQPLEAAAHALAEIGPREHYVPPPPEPVWDEDVMQYVEPEPVDDDWTGELESEGEAAQDSGDELPELLSLLSVADETEVSETADESEFSAPAAGAGAESGASLTDDGVHGGGQGYPGIAILPDELGAARSAVVFSITEAELARVAAATDPGLWQTLTQAMSDFNNGDRREQTVANAMAFMEAEKRDKAIRDHADALRRAAMTADKDMLAAMLAAMNEGWP